MTRPIRISASILSADFARLGEEVEAAEAAGCDEIHFDVMDGHFVPNLSFGIPVLEAVRRHTSLPIDVHMMVQDPEKLIAPFAEAGADSMAIHVEACRDLRAAVRAIRTAGMRAGLAINPETPLDAVHSLLDEVQEVVVMTVHPGFGGQEFLPEVLPKLAALRARLVEASSPVEVAVDGGIKRETAGSVVEAGATTLVAGSGIFEHPGGIAAGVREIREGGQEAVVRPSGA